MQLDLGSSRVPYAVRMGEEPHVLIKIDTASPIELGDFVALFVSVGSQFDKFIAAEHPEEKGDARFFVKEVRAGCIEAELVGWLAAGPIVGGAFAAMKNLNTLAKFVENYGGKLRKYFKPGGRQPDAGKGDLSDFHKTVSAIANDPAGNLTIAAARYKEGEREMETVFHFGTAEAREAERQIADHRLEIEATSGADHSRVLMTFVRSDKRAAKPGKRSGEMVVIDRISPKALPIVYASSLAEQRIKHEINEGAVYKRGFDVDVNVETRNGAPLAYRIVALHDIIEIPDDEG